MRSRHDFDYCECGRRKAKSSYICRNCERNAQARREAKHLPAWMTSGYKAVVVSCPDNEYQRGAVIPSREFDDGTTYSESSLTLGYCFPHGMVVEMDGGRYMVVGNKALHDAMAPEDDERWVPQTLIPLEA